MVIIAVTNRQIGFPVVLISLEEDTGEQHFLAPDLCWNHAKKNKFRKSLEVKAWYLFPQGETYISELFHPGQSKSLNFSPFSTSNHIIRQTERQFGIKSFVLSGRGLRSWFSPPRRRNQKFDLSLNLSHEIPYPLRPFCQNVEIGPRSLPLNPLFVLSRLKDQGPSWSQHVLHILNFNFWHL